MTARPFTRKLLWIYLGVFLVCAPFSVKIPEEYALIRFATWLLLPLTLAMVLASIIAMRGSWTLEKDRLFKGGNISDGIDLDDIEWLLIGKPMTVLDEKRYRLTKGSNRHVFWKVIENTLCIKTRKGKYVRLDVFFHNGGIDLINLIKANCSGKTIGSDALSDKELRAFKNGDSNRIFSL